MPTRSKIASPFTTGRSVKPYLSLDHIVTFSLNASYNAMHGWLRGRPLDEIALLNRLTDELQYNTCPERPKLLRSPIYDLRRQLFVLHHRGGKYSGDIGGTDAYGADLAVTINIFQKPPKIGDPIGPSVFSKTALFQLKRGKAFLPSLERRQLKQTRKFAGHSFVLYADEEAAEFRIRSTQKVLAKFPAAPKDPEEKEKSQDVPTHDWQTLSEWLVDWLTCQVGKFSDDSQRLSIESALRKFIIWDEVSDEAFVRFSQNTNGIISPDFASSKSPDNTGLPPAASWMVVDVYSSAFPEVLQ